MSFAALNNFFHLLATVTWIGGMIYSNLVLFPSLTVATPPERGKIMGAIAKRFSVAAWISVIVLIITGLIKTPSDLLFNTSSDFGFWLTIKHILILIMIISGLFISLVLAPRMSKLAPKPGDQPTIEFIKAQLKLKNLSVLNMMFGILVLLSVSMMKF